MNKQEIIDDLCEFYETGENGAFSKYLPEFEQAVKESQRRMTDMPKPRKGPRSSVFITAYTEGGGIVEETQLSYDDYYGGLSPVLDSDSYRAERSIIRLTIRIVNSRGAAQSEFDNSYGENGEYRIGRAILGDGAVVDM